MYEHPHGLSGLGKSPAACAVCTDAVGTRALIREADVTDQVITFVVLRLSSCFLFLSFFLLCLSLQTVISSQQLCQATFDTGGAQELAVMGAVAA